MKQITEHIQVQARTIEIDPKTISRGLWQTTSQTLFGSKKNQPYMSFVPPGYLVEEPQAYSDFWEPTTYELKDTQIKTASFMHLSSVMLENVVVDFDDDAANQGSGLNFFMCANVTLVNPIFRYSGSTPPTKGSRGYGSVFSGCRNVVIRNALWENCHSGTMFTDGTDGAQIHGGLMRNTWMIDGHSNFRKLLFSGIRSEKSTLGFGRIHLGNLSQPLGGTLCSVTDCADLAAVEIAGRAIGHKIQRTYAKELRTYQYHPVPGDTLSIYPMEYEIDGTCRFNTQIHGRYRAPWE